ncbi:MAG: hypothetical protein AB7V04_00540 [Desulfomonilaceae bacterium]
MLLTYKTTSLSVNCNAASFLEPQSDTAAGSSVSLKITSGMHQAKGSQTRITCEPIVATTPIRIHRGIDFLKVSYWLIWHETNFLDILEFMKRKLQETEDEQVAVFRSKELEWNLQRTGASKFSYRLKAGDVTLLFSRRASQGNIPNFRLEIGSLTSQTWLFQTINDIRHWLERQGAEFEKEQVSEVHLAADFIGLDLKALDIEDQNRWIQRSHSFSPYYEHRKLTGISMGKGNFMLRIYDKVTELRRSEHKQEIFKELWQVETYNEHPVTRVEFQLRRPVLKEFNHLEYCNQLDTVKQLLFGVRALWKYATSEWARFMATSIDRNNKHQGRAHCSEFWNIVQGVNWTGLEELRREKITRHKDIVALRKQARGFYMSIAASCVRNVEDINEVILYSQEVIEQDLRDFFKDKDKFIQRMKKKRNEIVVDTVPF